MILLIGLAVYVHGPGMGGNGGYGMMGEGGMMGGYGAGQGMMDWYGRSDRNQYGPGVHGTDTGGACETTVRSVQIPGLK